MVKMLNLFLISLSEQPYKIGISTHCKLLQLRQEGGREVENLRLHSYCLAQLESEPQFFWLHACVIFFAKMHPTTSTVYLLINLLIKHLSSPYNTDRLWQYQNEQDPVPCWGLGEDYGITWPPLSQSSVHKVTTKTHIFTNNEFHLLLYQSHIVSILWVALCDSNRRTNCISLIAVSSSDYTI